MSRTRLALLMSAAIPLAACGADDVASPGEGNIVIVTPPAPPTPAPPPPPPPGPPPPPPPTGARFEAVTPADGCPIGTTDTGAIDGDADGTFDFRTCQVSGTITGTVTLSPSADATRGLVYTIAGRVDIGEDVGGDGQAGGTTGVLNIDPGAVLVGGGTTDFIVVQRGSQMNAVGTAQAPIIFTARANFSGGVNANSIGLFGGLVLLGRGPINQCQGGGTPATANCQAEVEGTTGAFYGGDQPGADSGTLRYVQVRYPGFEVSTGNELNGITLGGVGNATEISFVQVHNSSDDGFEWFGGTVDGDHLVVTGADDDSLDVDNGYTGTNQFIIVRQRTGGGDHYIESDSRNQTTPFSDPTFANFTFYGGGGSAESPNAVLQREGIVSSLVNGIIGDKDACININDQVTIDNGPPSYNSVVLACANPYTDDGNIDVATIMTIFEMDANNDPDFTRSVTNGFVNGANETGVTAATVADIDTDLMQVGYIGAVEEGATADNVWTANWTCGLFGSALQGSTETDSCLATPFYNGADDDA